MKTEDVLAEVDALAEMLTETEAGLTDIPTLVNDRKEQTLLTIFADSEDDRTAVSKWFSHLVDGDEQQSAVEAVLIDDEAGEPTYALVRSEMYSSRKQHSAPDDGDDGTYHALWVVGHDDSIAQEFFIHRVDWKRRFEKPLTEADWSISDVRRWLGFDLPLPDAGEELETGMWYQSQGDVALRVTPLSAKIESAVKSRANNEVNRKTKRARQDAVDDSPLADVDSLSITTGSLGSGRLSVRAKPSDTDGLRDLQERLGVSEDTIRGMMRDDWQKLTAGRRSDLIERWVRNQIEEAVDEPDEEAIKAEAREQVEAEIPDDLTQTNVRVGNHLVIFEEGWQNTPGTGTGSLSGEAHVTLPTETEVVLIHDEHGTVRRRLGPGIVSIDVLDRHERA
ncbi:hypothetical protein [Halovenus sp. HT40]|uniref:hypothetical protein n=1 Tax=Halovenus sp. HT40 TaxID=3126691 RepID=UPI00300EF40E